MFLFYFSYNIGAAHPSKVYVLETLINDHREWWITWSLLGQNPVLTQCDLLLLNEHPVNHHHLCRGAQSLLRFKHQIPSVQDQFMTQKMTRRRILRMLIYKLTFDSVKSRWRYLSSMAWVLLSRWQDTFSNSSSTVHKRTKMFTNIVKLGGEKRHVTVFCIYFR